MSRGAALALLVLAGCAQTGRPPVAERSPVFDTARQAYQVQPGDTLYSIAWRFGLDHRALARVNDIRAPYTIYVGQTLRLTAQRPAAAARAPAPAVGPGGWRTPTAGQLARNFGDGNRGLDFRLEPANDVAAAAAGEVVYAGSGLGGFRHLVILEHDAEYLSAYGFDRPLAVREGERVKAGGLLADKEGEGHRAATLHFEIRRNGDPVDPRPLLGRTR